MAQWTTTYAGLVSLLATYCEDTSTDFTNLVGGCINRAEERIIRDMDLRYFDGTKSSSTAVGVATIAKTSDMVTIKSVQFAASGDHAQPRAQDYIQMYAGSGRPLYWFEDETTIRFAPTPDAVYAISINYVGRPTALSESNTTNWLTQNVADLLLFGALVESEHLLIAPERVAEFEQRYASLLGPARALYRDDAATPYLPLAPTPTPQATR